MIWLALRGVGVALTVILCTQGSSAVLAQEQTAPALPPVVASEPVRLPFPFHASDGGQAFQEMPPDPVPGLPHHYIVAGWETYDCVAPWALGDVRKVAQASCTQLQAPVVDDTREQFRFGPESVATQAPWRRNYYGSFTVLRVKGANGDPVLLSINHGENKGKSQTHVAANRGTAFATTIAPNMKNTVGVVSDVCTEANGCYFAFVGASWMSLRGGALPQPEKLIDDGPIVWPSSGYVSADGETKLSSGPRCPTAIVKDGEVYVFYVDTRYTNGRDGGEKADFGERRSGLKVMRAVVRPPAAPRFEVYFDGRFGEAALPAGYSNDRALDFVATPGPRATPLFGPSGRGSKETLEFAAARIAGTDLYLGVEQYEDFQDEGVSECRGQGKLALRISRDLVHWSPRHDIYGCASRKQFKMWYPRFVDEAGAQTTEIDPKNFKILGTALYERDASGLQLYSMNVSLDRSGR